MIFIIDGTGKADSGAYASEMANGFCKRLERKAGGHYWRGPTLWGLETINIARNVTDAVIKWRKSAKGNEKLFLAGHSRGGAAAIYAAQDLKARESTIQIEALFLFDAVERVPFSVSGIAGAPVLPNLRSATVIPGNVLHCYHALRDGSLSRYYSDGVRAARDKVAACLGLRVDRRTNDMEMAIDHVLAKTPLQSRCAHVIEAARKLVEQDNKMKIAMRSSWLHVQEGAGIDFGNCGTAAEAPCHYAPARFLGSHGAIGGAPLDVSEGAPTLLIESDRAAMASVDAWMSAHMCKHGVFKGGRIRE